MTDSEVRVVRWPAGEAVSERRILATWAREGLRGPRWSNGPHDRYAAHSHPYDKVVMVLRGSITFGLPDTGERHTLTPGDRLELPRGIRHEALVGPEGVQCMEAHR